MTTGIHERATGAANRQRLYTSALALAIITVFYNVVEGLVSIFFGLTDETVTLFGFGVDSFVEVISGIGIWHMVLRLRAGGDAAPDRFEQRALRTTGTAFYLLTAGLVLTSAATLITRHRPEATLWGVVISLVSIATMWLLIRYKMKVGTALGSQAIVADARCNRACVQFSIVLLVASAAYELTGLWGIDSAGALLIAWLAFREGREAFERARGLNCACD